MLLYISVDLPEEQINSDYYMQKIERLFDSRAVGMTIKIANSRVFPLISREAMKEFLKTNKRNKIMQLNELIDKMFTDARFDEIIESLEDFADSQKLVI